MRLQDFISSKLMTRLGIVLGRYMPRRMGYGLARIAAGIIARRKPGVYWTVHANLRQILGPEADDGLASHAALHQMTHQVFFHAGQTYYDFFHAIGQPKEVIDEMLRIPDDIVAFVRAETARGQGVLLLIPHMSNFDLLGLSVGTRDLPIQMLSLANPQAGFHLLNHLRAAAGFEVTPITPQSLRAAIRRLKSGGIAVTGVDRPIAQDRELVEFFGRPAYLPVGPVRLALMTDALVIMASCYYEPDKGYAIEVAEPLEMTRTGDRRRDILTNISRVADILEQHVRARPEQWMMFHPVWPE
jgi:lauroyl/myristoyl acyltransferase